MAEHPREYYEALMMKAVDGLLNDAERRELEAFIAENPEKRSELADFQLISETTDTMRQRILADAAIEPPRESRGVRGLLLVGFLLLLVGVLSLYGHAAFAFASDSSIPVFVKVGAGVAMAGALILFAYALRVRLRGLKHDPYQEIDR